jgi:hypothetical protein
MLNTTCNILDSLIAARYSKDKRDILFRANLHIEQLRFQVRLCHDEKLISEKQYLYISGLIIETGSMTGGWLKSIQR